MLHSDASVFSDDRSLAPIAQTREAQIRRAGRARRFLGRCVQLADLRKKVSNRFSGMPASTQRRSCLGSPLGHWASSASMMSAT